MTATEEDRSDDRLAKAWDEGYDTGYEDQRYRDTTKPMPPNPYAFVAAPTTPEETHVLDGPSFGDYWPTPEETQPVEVVYGVVLDDLGSVDQYDTREEAEHMLRTLGGLGLVRITQERLTTEETQP